MTTAVPLAHQVAPPQAMHLPQHESSEYRYCTNFAVTGGGLDAREFIPKLEQIGDCVLVVGDEATLKVHVHTDDPDLATSMFIAHGEVSHFDVADMHEQVADRNMRLDVACSPIVVASGEGLVQLFRELGAHVVDGGPTMNPSTYDILAGIDAAPGSSAVVLPNSPNVISRRSGRRSCPRRRPKSWLRAPSSRRWRCSCCSTPRSTPTRTPSG